MEFFKTWIIPPLVGAIIGYFTNWLAIKMLFRPLKPIYLGKMKLPFTPGILPRERLRLTDSVGETVSRELLTAEVFRSRLMEPTLKEKIERSIYIIIDEFLGNDASLMLKGLAGSAAGQDTDTGSAGFGAAGYGAATASSPAPSFAATEAGGLAASSLAAILRSGEFRAALAEAAGRAAVAAGTIPIGDLLPAARLRELAERFAEDWGEDSKQAMVSAFVDKLIEPSPDSGPLVSARALSPLLEVGTRSLYSSLLPVIEKIMESEPMRAELNTLAMEMVRRAIGRLGPLQRLIVTAANYEKTLADTMPETIKDVSASLMRLLRNPQAADRIVESVLNYARTPRITDSRTPVGGIFPTAELKNALGKFFRELQSEKTGFAENVERRYLSIAQKPLGQIIPGLPESLAAGLTSSLSSFPEADDARPNPGSMLLSDALGDFVLSYAKRLEGKTMGEVLGLGEEGKRKIAGLLATSVASALSSQAERLVEALDIQSMVVEKINGLDMADVERIILHVVNDELAWITVLGGILGALIGVAQSLLSLL
ncbi:MAG: DUF445 family protein [Spirochaetales bacterium]|jgi:hypothetical protein